MGGTHGPQTEKNNTRELRAKHLGSNTPMISMSLVVGPFAQGRPTLANRRSASAEAKHNRT
jgi:hypothetical protein